MANRYSKTSYLLMGALLEMGASYGPTMVAPIIWRFGFNNQSNTSSNSSLLKITDASEMTIITYWILEGRLGKVMKNGCLCLKRLRPLSDYRIRRK